jgi:hypothetical protein
LRVYELDEIEKLREHATTTIPELIRPTSRRNNACGWLMVAWIAATANWPETVLPGGLM